MRKIFFTLVAVIMFMCQIAQAQPSPQWVKNLPIARSPNVNDYAQAIMSLGERMVLGGNSSSNVNSGPVEQMIVVAGLGGTTAWISMHERNASGDWEMIMTTPGFIGKNGLGKVREGDHKTPVGTFRFNFAFGIAPDPGCAIPYVQVNENHYWSGDWNYKYNQFVDVREAPANFETRYSEHLIDYNPHYLYGLNMGYNSDCTPGKGSALFMHCFGSVKPWTGGCVALPEAKMLFVMQHIRPNCACVIDTLENLGGKI
jgi:L,D-peptidoglycan transpeptidase YkuD (ErfK/YbiS/YcfS/YnhG family)